MNYSPRADKTRRGPGAARKQVPGAQSGLLITAGPGMGRPRRSAGASALGAREKLALIRGRSPRPARAFCQTPGLRAITGGPAGQQRQTEGSRLCARAPVACVLRVVRQPARVRERYICAHVTRACGSMHIRWPLVWAQCPCVVMCYGVCAHVGFVYM